MDFHLKIDSAVEMSIAAFRTGEKSRISVFFASAEASTPSGSGSDIEG